MKYQLYYLVTSESVGTVSFESEVEDRDILKYEGLKIAMNLIGEGVSIDRRTVALYTPKEAGARFHTLYYLLRKEVVECLAFQSSSEDEKVCKMQGLFLAGQALGKGETIDHSTLVVDKDT